MSWEKTTWNSYFNAIYWVKVHIKYYVPEIPNSAIGVQLLSLQTGLSLSLNQQLCPESSGPSSWSRSLAPRSGGAALCARVTGNVPSREWPHLLHFLSMTWANYTDWFSSHRYIWGIGGSSPITRSFICFSVPAVSPFFMPLKSYSTTIPGNVNPEWIF